MATQTMNDTHTFARTNDRGKIRIMDLLVTMVGSVIACCGYYATDMTLMLAQG